MTPIAAKIVGIRSGSDGWKTLDEPVVLLGVFSDAVVLIRKSGNIECVAWRDIHLNAKLNIIPVAMGGIPVDGGRR